MIILWVGSISIDHKLWLGLILPAETGAFTPTLGAHRQYYLNYSVSIEEWLKLPI